MTSLLQAFAVALVVITFTTLIFPLNVPIAAGAYLVYHQGKPPKPGFETQEFWVRSTFTALGLAGLTAVFLLILYVLVDAFEMQDVQGPIEVAVFCLYLPLAIGYVFWMYALDDMMQGAGIFFLYVLMPGLPFLFIYWIAHLSTRISAWVPWLLPAAR